MACDKPCNTQRVAANSISLAYLHVRCTRMRAAARVDELAKPRDPATLALDRTAPALARHGCARHGARLGQDVARAAGVWERGQHDVPVERCRRQEAHRTTHHRQVVPSGRKSVRRHPIFLYYPPPRCRKGVPEHRWHYTTRPPLWFFVSVFLKLHRTCRGPAWGSAHVQRSTHAHSS